MEAELYGEVFEPLKELAFFKQVKVNPETNTVEWPNGADFAPEFLYEIGDEVGQVTTSAGIHKGSLTTAPVLYLGGLIRANQPACLFSSGRRSAQS